MSGTALKAGKPVEVKGKGGGKATYQFSSPALMAGGIACKDAMRVAVLHVGRGVKLVGRHDEELWWWAMLGQKGQLRVVLMW